MGFLDDLRTRNAGRGRAPSVSVYGLGRFPVTLYYEQWIRLLGAADELKRFLEEQKSEGKLKLKEG